TGLNPVPRTLAYEYTSVFGEGRWLHQCGESPVPISLVPALAPAVCDDLARMLRGWVAFGRPAVGKIEPSSAVEDLRWQCNQSDAANPSSSGATRTVSPRRYNTGSERHDW